MSLLIAPSAVPVAQHLLASISLSLSRSLSPFFFSLSLSLSLSLSSGNTESRTAISSHAMGWSKQCMDIGLSPPLITWQTFSGMASDYLPAYLSAPHPLSSLLFISTAGKKIQRQSKATPTRKGCFARMYGEGGGSLHRHSASSQPSMSLARTMIVTSTLRNPAYLHYRAKPCFKNFLTRGPSRPLELLTQC